MIDEQPPAAGPWTRPTPAETKVSAKGGGPWQLVQSPERASQSQSSPRPRGPGPRGYIHANLGARLGAKLLDLGVLGLALAPGSALALYLDMRWGGGVAMIGAAGYCARQWSEIAKQGQSLGKRWLGLRIISEAGERVGVMRAVLLRVIMMTAGSALLLGVPLLVDPLFVFGRRRQCLHDRLARTLVIEARTPGDPYA